MGDSEPAILNDTSLAFNISEILLEARTAEDDVLDEPVYGICGANFCPGATSVAANPNLKPPPASKINMISAIYLGCMVVACLVVAFGVDSMKRWDIYFDDGQC